MTERERAELQALVSWSAVLGRALLFVIAIAIVGAAFRGVQAVVEGSPGRSVGWPVWLVPRGSLRRIV